MLAIITIIVEPNTIISFFFASFPKKFVMREFCVFFISISFSDVKLDSNEGKSKKVTKRNN